MPGMHEFAGNIASSGQTFLAAGASSLILFGAGIKYMANAGQNERLIKQHRSKSTYQKDTRRQKSIIVASAETGLPIEKSVPRHSEGEMYGIVKRGWRSGMPFIRSYRKVSLKQQNGRIDDFNVQRTVDATGSAKKMLVQSKVNFAIIDEPYAMNRATFNFETTAELNQSVLSVCASGLRKITPNMHELALNDSAILIAGIEAVERDDLFATGVELRALKIINFTEADSQILASSHADSRPPNLSKVAHTDLNVETELRAV
jgi:hypothetical protein